MDGVIYSLIQAELWLAIIATIVFTVVLIKFLFVLDDFKKITKNFASVMSGINAITSKMHSSIDGFAEIATGLVTAYEELKKVKIKLLDHANRKKGE